jgi:hypothetical protein
MFGVVVLRYVLRLEPLASVDIEELVELLAPTIQRYLGEQLPETGTPIWNSERNRTRLAV